jgi:uncharacterized protein
MLRVDLGRLAREGSVLVEAQVPADDALWQGSDIRWDGPVDVRLRASYAGSGEVVVRGTVKGQLEQECRRCLRPVRERFDDELTLVFVSGATGEDTDEGDAFVFDPVGGSLDLSEAVREEVLLAMNPYVVCDPECRGLCPRCGKNLNEGPCDCAEEEGDPRWETLRALKGR